MMSESESWPVSMMIGALKPLLQDANCIATVEIGQPDIHDDEIQPDGRACAILLRHSPGQVWAVFPC